MPLLITPSMSIPGGGNIILTNVRHENDFIIEWVNYHL